MKRWIAGLFAAMLCCIGAVAYAQECAHEMVRESAYYIYNSYKKNDEDTHLCTLTLMIKTNCAVCDEKIGERKAGQFDVPERHDWNRNGVCYLCQERNTCDHINTGELKIELGTTVTDLGDGLHHHAVTEVEVITACSDCGIQIGDSRTETREYDEAHTMKYACLDCDYEAVCPHEGETYEFDWLSETRFEKIDKDTHAVYGTIETLVYCRDCDEELSTAKGGTEQLLYTGSHYYWRNNICEDCGFERNLIDCEHSDTVLKLKEVYDQSYRCVEINSTSHKKTGIYAEINYCTECGEEIGEILRLKKVAQIEKHNYSDAHKHTCEGCGYRNTCPHDGETHTVVKRETWWEAVSIDENIHKVDCIAYRYIYCDQCGARLSGERLGRQWLVEDHEMEGDGCPYCDYRMACSHENTVKRLKQSSDYLYCNSISSNAHSAAYHLYKYEYCEDCGTFLQNYNETYAGVKEVNEPHNMVNHRCVECGYCEHPAEQIETTSKYLASEYAQYNAYLHECRSMQAYTSTCQLCGEAVKEWTEDDYSNFLSHSYNTAGTCHDCGYVNMCKHANAYCVMNTGAHYTYQNIDDPVQHKEIRQYYSAMFCPDCLMTWDSQLLDAIKEIMKNHSFSSQTGECYYCGYVNPCTHENKEVYQIPRVSDMVYVNEKYHSIYHDETYESVRCLDCGMVLEGEEVKHEPVLLREKEEHYFYDLDTCSCGYVNPCKHMNTLVGKINSSAYALQCDDRHHEYVEMITKGLFCADCGKMILRYVDREESRSYGEHRFDDFGVCSWCNYVNTCKHKETKVNRIWSFDEYPNVNDMGHEVRHWIEEEEVCISCGETINSKIVEEETVWQSHIGKDACSLCHWSKPEHVCTCVLNNWYSTYAITAIDALTHTAVVQNCRVQVCSFCNWIGREWQMPVETIVEKHNFSMLGRCEDCGYVNFCEHEETYEKQIPDPISGYTQKDESEHTYVADVTTQTRCVICDQLLSYTAALNVECTEAHVFDNVADLVCDLCGYEKEAPEDVPTPEPTKKPDSGNSGDTVKPGVYVTAKTDKKRYAEDETAALTITIRNATDEKLENVQIHHLLPDELCYATDQDMSVFEPFDVGAQKTVKRVVYVKMLGKDQPKTGDDSQLGFWLLLAAACLGTIAALRMRRSKA